MGFLSARFTASPGARRKNLFWTQSLLQRRLLYPRNTRPFSQPWRGRRARTNFFRKRRALIVRVRQTILSASAFRFADGHSQARLPASLWCRRRLFVGMIVEVMMSPPPMSLFYLLQFLTLFVGELGGHLAMRAGNDLAHSSPRVSSNISQLSS